MADLIVHRLLVSSNSLIALGYFSKQYQRIHFNGRTENDHSQLLEEFVSERIGRRNQITHQNSVVKKLIGGWVARTRSWMRSLQKMKTRDFDGEEDGKKRPVCQKDLREVFVLQPRVSKEQKKERGGKRTSVLSSVRPFLSLKITRNASKRVIEPTGSSPSPRSSIPSLTSSSTVSPKAAKMRNW